MSTGAIGYRLNSINRLQASRRIGQARFLASAIDISKRHYSGTQEVGLIRYHWNSLLSSPRISSASKICKALELPALTQRLSGINLHANTSSRNTFPFPEFLYDETLVFSPQVFLLGILFHDQAFAAYNLTSPEALGRLYIPPGRNELPLRLNKKLDDIPLFRKAVRTPTGWTISPTEPLPYPTLLPWIKALGRITGFAQVTRPYSFRYAGGKAFNDNGRFKESS